MPTTGYENINELNRQANGLYDEQMKQQQNIINTGTQQAIDEIERNKQKLQEQTDKTNKALYTDYQKQINPYGVEAENMAEQGLNNTGVSESARTNYYNTYQNARSEATSNANTIMADFNSQITQARQNGDKQLAQAAIDMYKQKVNDLYQMYGLKFNQQQFDYQKSQDALTQSNWMKEYEQALQQAKWQQQFSQNQFDYQKSQDALSQSNWEKEFGQTQSNWEKEYAQALQQALWQQRFNQSQFDYQKQLDKQSQSNWEKEFALSKKSLASKSSGSSGNLLVSGSSGSTLKTTSNELSKTAQNIQNDYGQLLDYARNGEHVTSPTYKEDRERQIADSLASLYQSGKITQNEFKTICNNLKL